MSKILSIIEFVKNYFATISTNTLGAFSIICLNLATMPALVTVLLGKTDHLPSLDVVLFIWAALVAIFVKSLIERNIFYVILVALGFLSQTVIMSLILFK